MGIEEGGEGVQPLGLDDLGRVLVGGPGLGQLGDPAAADDDVVDAVDAGCRIEYRGVAQNQVRRLAGCGR